MKSEEIVKKTTVKLKTLQLLGTNLIKVQGRRQTSEIKKNNLTEKRLNELRELKNHNQESLSEEEEDMEKVSNWGKELESKLLSCVEMKTEIETSLEKLSFETDDKAKRLKEKLNKQKLEKKFAEEVKIEEEDKRKDQSMKRNLAKNKPSQKEIKVKLPKLEITQFNRTLLVCV